MKGYMGKLLFVDLSTGKIEKRDLDERLARKFIGGPSLGAAILYEEMPAHTDVFAPESMIGFLGGPANNSGSMMAGRWTVVSKSPVTNGFNDASSGGLFAVMLRKSGYDGVFVKGIAEKPVYIFIDNGEVEIRDASRMWGMTTVETEAALREELGDKKFDAALIAPGGERMCWTAGIMNDSHRTAARGGSGAVMGSKKLKALVCCGNLPLDVYSKEEIQKVNKMVMDWFKNGPTSQGPLKAWRDWGTNNAFPSNYSSGDASVKNWTGNPFTDMTEEQVEHLSVQYSDAKWKKKKYACASCPLACGAIYSIHEGGMDGDDFGRPEYETVGMFGSQVLCGDALLVQKCNHYCNEYGLDTISVGGTIAWAMECYEKGILSKEELDGVELTWGNVEAVEAMCLKICKGEGVGNILANGSRYAADHFGKGHECLVVAGGIELPQHDSRWSTGLTRTYKYDPTPGRHVKGGLGPAFGNAPPEVRFDYGGHGKEDVAGVIKNDSQNLGGFCNFADFAFPPTAVVDYINACTGFGFTPEEGDDLGRRSFTIRTAFNVREGIVPRRDATLSDRMVGIPPMEEGPLAGVTVDVELMADKFYEEMHYDVATGIPTKEELERLGGMENVIRDLYPEG